MLSLRVSQRACEGIAIVKAGYEALFTVYGQKLTFGSPMDSLGRYMIEGNKPKVFAEAINFGGEIFRWKCAVAEVNAVTLGVQPPDGETINNTTPMIKANLAGFGPIDQGSVQMRVSGLGLVNANYDPKTKNISYQIRQKLQGKAGTVIIEAKSGGRKVSTHWSFIIDEAGAKAVDSPPPAAAPKKHVIADSGERTRPRVQFSAPRRKHSSISKSLRSRGRVRSSRFFIR